MNQIWYDEKGNARCGKCMRMLYKCIGTARPAGVEIKCHSCKALNVSEFRLCRNCKWCQHGCCMNDQSQYVTQIRKENDGCDKWQREEERRMRYDRENR